jgi:hypothetical protein
MMYQPFSTRHLAATLHLVAGRDHGSPRLSTKETNLAMQRGEVAASCSLLAYTIMTTLLDEVNSGRLKFFIQMGPQRSDKFGPGAQRL